MATSAPPGVPPRVRQLATDLVDAKPMRRGSLSERAVGAANPAALAHKTPRLVTAHTTASRMPWTGKRVSRFLTAEEAGVVEQQIEAGREFRAKVGAYWEACEEWADVELAAG